MRKAINNLGSLALSVLLAFFIWVAAVNEQNPPREDYYPGDLPIELDGRPANMELVQPLARTTARVRMRAPQASWERLQSNSARAYLDLRGATAGLREYEVQVDFADPNIVKLSVDPPRVSLRLEETREKTVPVRIVLSGEPAIGYALGQTEPLTMSAQVSGAQSRVEQVTSVAANVSTQSAKSSFERDVPLLPYNAQGEVVNGVRLNPATIKITVPIEQRLGYKDVSVKVDITGTVASGYWVSNITVEPTAVTIVGNPRVLETLGSVIQTEPIDLNGAKTSFLRRAGFVLSAGVTPLSTTQTVLVTIGVAPITGGQTVQRRISTRGLERGLQATISPETVDVILSGPLPILQTLQLDDVQVFLDLASVSKGAGKYQLTPSVLKPDTLKIERIVPDKIDVTISNTGLMTLTRPVTFNGLGRGLRLAFLPDTVAVVLSGSLIALQNLKEGDVQVSLNLQGKGVGRYTLAPVITKPDTLTLESVLPETIEVEIMR
jgi:YbbR domain-containing protein